MRALVRSYGVSSHSTSSPTSTRIRFLRMRPAVWAMISCSFSGFTRKVAFGSSSVTTPGNSRTSSGSREENSLLITDLDGASVEESSLSLSQSQLVKVKGGEYFGLLNARGQKHGVGKMTYDNGNEYEGQWKNNKRDGKGTTKYASGNVYTGKTVNHSLPSFDCIHHRVMLTTLNVILVTYQLSSSSSGSWKEGKRHGFGVFHIKKTGDIYSKTVNHSFASFL